MWTHALEVASQHFAMDPAGGVLDHFRHLIVSGRLVDREAIDREWVYGWIEAGVSEFLVGAKEHDEEYAKLDELRAALGVET